MGVDWLDGFLKKFVRRLDPPEWPKLGTEEYADFRDDWAYALNGHRVTEAEADEALMRLRQDPPQWLREHLPKFVAAVEQVRRERAAQAESSDLERAKAAAKGCQHCGGSGQRQVFDPYYDGRYVVTREAIECGEVKLVRYPMVVTAHCTCALGRWMRGQIRDLSLLGRILDLADVLAGRSRYRLADPTGDQPGPWFARSEAKGGAVRVKDGIPA
jgi:hypothetical protein